MNTPVQFKLSMLELSKALMYKFWYDYVKPKYNKKEILLYRYIKTNDIYKDIAEDVERRFKWKNHDKIWWKRIVT